MTAASHSPPPNRPSFQSAHRGHDCRVSACALQGGGAAWMRRGAVSEPRIFLARPPPEGLDGLAGARAPTPTRNGPERAIPTDRLLRSPRVAALRRAPAAIPAGAA